MNRRDFINQAWKATAVGIIVPEWAFDPLWGKSQVVSGGVPFEYMASFWEKVPNTWAGVAKIGEMVWMQHFQSDEIMPGERITINGNLIRDLEIKHNGDIGGVNIIGNSYAICLYGCDFSNVNGEIHIGQESDFKIALSDQRSFVLPASASPWKWAKRLRSSKGHVKLVNCYL